MISRVRIGRKVLRSNILNYKLKESRRERESRSRSLARHSLIRKEKGTETFFIEGKHQKKWTLTLRLLVAIYSAFADMDGFPFSLLMVVVTPASLALRLVDVGFDGWLNSMSDGLLSLESPAPEASLSETLSSKALSLCLCPVCLSLNCIPILPYAKIKTETGMTY